MPRMSLKWFKILLTFVQILKYYLHIMPNAEKTVSRAKNVRKQRNMWEKLGNFKKTMQCFFVKSLIQCLWSISTTQTLRNLALLLCAVVP